MEGVGQQTLHVALPDSNKVADNHAAYRDRNNDRKDHVLPGLKPVHDDPQKSRHGAHLGSGRQKGRGRRGCSLVGVRRPHMERHRGHFESKTDQQKAKPEQEPRVRSALALNV